MYLGKEDLCVPLCMGIIQPLCVCRSKSRQVCTRGDFPSEQIPNGWMEKILLSNKR
jgi:hypothetical protein